MGSPQLFKIYQVLAFARVILTQNVKSPNEFNLNGEISLRGQRPKQGMRFAHQPLKFPPARDNDEPAPPRTGTRRAPENAVNLEFGVADGLARHVPELFQLSVQLGDAEGDASHLLAGDDAVHDGLMDLQSACFQ